MKPEEIRVFISSTFLDLPEERECLAKRVFPPLRAMCRERGIDLVDIDLRWGLTAEEYSLGRTIRSCLEEIDQCRPFFIGIIGTRYGWVPSLKEIQKDPKLLVEFPWVEEMVLDRRSILEMEFAYGALHDPKNAEGAFFYVRDVEKFKSLKPEIPETYQLTEAELQDQQVKLEALRNHVRASGLCRTTYESLAEFEECVRNDLREFIDERFPLPPTRTYIEEERKLHESFSIGRRRAYVAEQSTLEALREHVSGDEAPLVVTAVSGMGKSSLLSYFSHYLQRSVATTHHEPLFIVAHFIGASAESSSERGILKRISEEIRERYHIEQEPANDLETLRNEFPLWLSRIEGEKLVLVLDGLNYLSVDNGELTWLVNHLPTAVRVVASSTPGSSLDYLIEHGWQTHELSDLDRQDRETVAVRYLGEHHKGLSHEQLGRIVSDEKCAHPLFLKTLLEELRLFGSFTELDHSIDAYLQSSDLNDLMQKVLERIESDYGQELVSTALKYICASRDGLSRWELAMLCENVNRGNDEIDVLQSAMEYHLMLRNGRITFSHDLIRDSVRARYFPHGEELATHRALAEFFAANARDDHEIREELWQWRAAGEKETLKSRLASAKVFKVLSRPELHYEFIGHWVWCSGRDVAADSQPRFERLVASLERAGDPKAVYETLAAITSFYLSLSSFNAAQFFGTKALEVASLQFGEFSEQVVQILDKLGELHTELAEFDAATEHYMTALDALDNSPEPLPLREAEIYESLAFLSCKQRNLLKAESYCKKSLSILAPLEGQRLKVSNNLNTLAAIKLDLKDFDGAEQDFREVMRIRTEILGVNDPSTGQAINNLGQVLLRKGQFAESRQFLERALQISLKTYGPHHVESVSNMVNVATCLLPLGDHAGAFELLESSYQTQIQLVGEQHPLTALILTHIGRTHLASGAPQRAEIAFSEAEDILAQIKGLSPIRRFQSGIDIAVALARQGEFVKADQKFETVLGEVASTFGIASDAYLTLIERRSELSIKT